MRPVFPERAEQRVVDVGSGEGADLRTDGGAAERDRQHGNAGRQQRAARRSASSRKSESGHQRCVPGNE